VSLELSDRGTPYKQIDNRIRALWWQSVDVGARRESGLPSEIGSGSVQQNTKHDRDKNVSCDCDDINRGESIVPPEMVVPVNAFIVIEPGWMGNRMRNRQSKRPKAGTINVP